jgi:hypothetical protein
MDRDEREEGSQDEGNAAGPPPLVDQEDGDDDGPPTLVEPRARASNPIQGSKAEGKGLQLPIRPELFVPYKRSTTVEEDYLPVNWSAVGGLVCGVASVMLHNKLLCWLGVLLVCDFLASMRPSQRDTRQLLSAGALCFSGVVSSAINTYRWVSRVAETQSGLPGGITQAELEQVLMQQQ